MPDVSEAGTTIVKAQRFGAAVSLPRSAIVTKLYEAVGQARPRYEY